MKIHLFVILLWRSDNSLESVCEFLVIPVNIDDMVHCLPTRLGKTRLHDSITFRVSGTAIIIYTEHTMLYFVMPQSPCVTVYTTRSLMDGHWEHYLVLVYMLKYNLRLWNVKLLLRIGIQVIFVCMPTVMETALWKPCFQQDLTEVLLIYPLSKCNLVTEIEK